ncbi:DUF1194 domain-containing protein [Rubritepida flocculans]|uniref:DUF1194 domain-containing protein n=1 Tax=Rubritepida flocculans TaxID=182403 RepID=UPI00055C166B|nr:DUF1194 domain-containing protein [Rubritepida flocculans]
MRSNPSRPSELALVLAVDVSASVDRDEFGLMVEGLALAWRDARLHAALPAAGLAVAVLFWSEAQEVALPWRRIAVPAEAEALAEALSATPRLPAAGATALGEALAAALRLLAACPWPARRAAVDVSGDGRSNRGRPPAPLRDLAAASAVAINALAVLNEEPDLLGYMEEEVIGGPGAFAMACPDYAAFAEAMLRKLLREMAPAPPGIA